MMLVHERRHPLRLKRWKLMRADSVDLHLGDRFLRRPTAGLRAYETKLVRLEKGEECRRLAS
jgi:hypothetical protein